MKKILLLVALLFSPLAWSQVCDVTYTSDVDFIAPDGSSHDASTTTTVVYGVPMSDVLDNNKKGLKIVDMASRLQDKGGPYEIETGEVRSCDGKPPERIAATSVLFKGVTLRGMNQITREALRQASDITRRYEDRDKRGDKRGWDHSKAKKTKRDDLGRRIRDK